MSFMPLWAFRALSGKVQNNIGGRGWGGFCLRLIKQEKMFLSSNTSGLSGALVSRGDQNTSGLWAILSADERLSEGPQENWPYL